MKEDMTGVTIGIPVYNGEMYLHDTLDSLTRQDRQDITILVSDNASYDGTQDILSRWQCRDHRIRVFRQKTNIGAQRNFQFLADKAITPWFMFAAHDDKWSSNYVNALLCHALSERKCDLSLPRVVYTYEDTTPATQYDVDENMFTMEGTHRIRALLGAATGTWIYGLHRTRSIQNAFASISSYPYTWGFDMALVLAIILRANVSGTNNAVLTHLETTVSRDHYKPKTSREQFALGRAFRRTAIDVLRGEIADTAERRKLFIPVLAYADRHGFKIRRAIRNFFRELRG